MNASDIRIGDVLTCAETGKQFFAASDGISTNYARDAEGNVYSDEGVNIRERRGLLDRTRPFDCYVSSDGKHVTGWKGNVLGDIVRAVRTPLPFGRQFSHWHGKEYSAYTIRDVHGAYWHGKGSPGVCIRLHPSRSKVTP